MNESQAHKIAKDIEAICDQNKPEVWCKIAYDKKPELKFINIEISIILAPKHTRKMELKR